MSLYNTQQLELELFEEQPLFRRFTVLDVNQLSGTVKPRQVSAPNAAMRKIHLSIRAALAGLKPAMPHATAGVKGAKVVEHVKAHRGNQYLCCYDLESAYSKVQSDRLAEILRGYGVSEKVIKQIEQYCFDPQGGLVTGGLVSVQLFNLYAVTLIDEPLSALLQERGGLTYTRYLDDLIISSAAPIGRRFRKQILTIIRAAGFDINLSKARYIDLVHDVGPSMSVVLNGVGLRFNGQVYVPPRFREKLYRLLKAANAGEPVNPDLIHGSMGAFFAIRPKRTLMGRQEYKIVVEYRRYVRTKRRVDASRAARKAEKQRRYRRRRHLKPLHSRRHRHRRD